MRKRNEKKTEKKSSTKVKKLKSHELTLKNLIFHFHKLKELLRH